MANQLNLKIGCLIDNLLSKNISIVKIVNETEILAASEISDVYEAYSFDQVTKKSEWKRILQFTRHNSPRALYRVQTACGREVTITEDHNFLVLRNAQLILSKTTDLNNHDFLPIPTKIGEPVNCLDNVSVGDDISKEVKLFVSLPNFRSALEGNEEKMASSVSYSKSYRILNSDERVTYETYKSLMAIDTEFGEEAKFGLFHGNDNLPLTIKLTEDFLRFLGYYIAEGHAEKEYFTMSSGNNEIIDDFLQVMNKLKHLCLTRELKHMIMRVTQPFILH